MANNNAPPIIEAFASLQISSFAPSGSSSCQRNDNSTADKTGSLSGQHSTMQQVAHGSHQEEKAGDADEGDGAVDDVEV